MKKSVISLMILAVLLCAMGCKTTEVAGSGIKGQSATVAKSKVKIVDYQGATFGKEIPEWVVLVGEGNYSQSVLSKVMPDVDGKKVFVVMGQGDNLEFVRQWTDLVDVEVQVGDTMQRVVGKAVQAQMTGTNSQTGSTTEPSEIERRINMYKQAVSAVELNGLEKTASYWIEKQVLGDKKNVVLRDVFEYYTVWTMDEERFDAQLDAAMKNVDDNTSEGIELKKALSERLKNTMIASNDESVNSEADNQIVYGF